MTIKHIPPARAASLIREGAVLVDIREADEHARERIPGAAHHALSTIEGAALPQGEPIIFHCRSGNRTIVNAHRLAAAARGARVAILEGGLEAWRDAGLPVRKDPRRPIEIMRQVQIGAGSLVVAGVALGAAAHPGFYALSGFVGAGLVFAGATGFCGLAKLLALAPWNRAGAASISAGPAG
jgi:rhodanese-related sulfurtransferase